MLFTECNYACEAHKITQKLFILLGEHKLFSKTLPGADQVRLAAGCL